MREWIKGRRGMGEGEEEVGVGGWRKGKEINWWYC